MADKKLNQFQLLESIMGDDFIIGYRNPKNDSNQTEVRVNIDTIFAEIYRYLNEEIDARNQADSSLYLSINKEKTERIEAIQSLLTQIQNEIEARKQGDNVFDEKLSVFEEKYHGDMQFVGDAISFFQSKINSMEGIGGSLPHADLGEAPTSLSLSMYACESIWGTGGAFEIRAPLHSSIYKDTFGNVHLFSDIWNGTWVRNDNPQNLNHRWVLNNTQDTDPEVFDWADVGIDTVSIATDEFAGIVKGSVDIGILYDGSMSIKNITLNDESENHVLVDVYSKTLKLWLQRIRNNLKSIFRSIESISMEIKSISMEYVHHIENDPLFGRIKKISISDRPKYIQVDLMQDTTPREVKIDTPQSGGIIDFAAIGKISYILFSNNNNQLLNISLSSANSIPLYSTEKEFNIDKYSAIEISFVCSHLGIVCTVSNIIKLQ